MHNKLLMLRKKVKEQYMWLVRFDGEDHKFSSEDEAVTFFDKTVGSGAHGKEHWCDLFDEHVWEE